MTEIPQSDKLRRKGASGCCGGVQVVTLTGEVLEGSRLGFKGPTGEVVCRVQGFGSDTNPTFFGREKPITDTDIINDSVKGVGDSIAWNRPASKPHRQIGGQSPNCLMGYGRDLGRFIRIG